MRELRMVPLTAALSVFVSAWCGAAHAAGALRPLSSGAMPIELRDHQVKVLINNGFSKTEVKQTFHNPNPAAIDAVYEFPVPPDAALSEMNLEVGDRVLSGEVVERERAQRIYEQQVQSGKQAGLAVQNGYQNFRFSVGQVPANADATMSFVYYEPVAIDTGVARFLYPIERGGTDEGSSFWTGEHVPVSSFRFDLEIKSAAPVAEVRVPDVPGSAIQQLGPGHYNVHFETAPSALDHDVVAYYRLENDLPGRVEVVPYRPRAGGSGTFMLIVTPGIDLAPLEHGTDYVYVLDFSGSMEGKIATLKAAVARALNELGPEDRFRLLGFSDLAFEITRGFANATPANVAAASAALEAQGLLGGTNLYDALATALADCDADRVTSVFLVTDGVANQGIVDPLAFDALMRDHDTRVHGFLMGNSANWPLMELIAETSGGFYAPVSNQDDVLGQVLLAKSKLTHESMHDARLELSSAEVWDTTDFDFGKVYRGQQLVVFGRYAGAASARMNLVTKVRGQARSYATDVALPDVAEAAPELERLWALDMIHALGKQRLLGLMPEADARAKIREIALQYQLVTDETSMIVLDSAAFADNGIDRTNQTRVATEHAAQANGAMQPPPAAAPAPTGNAFPDSSASLDNDSSYGGALDPGSLALLAVTLLGLFGRRPRHAGVV